MSTKLESKIYTQDGKEAGKVSLPENVFGVAWNPDLVHEVVIAMQSNARGGKAHTKDRSEVRGGGKKPWKQKGTGRARHGSRRSPIWTGGGVTFGPRNEKDYSKKINNNARAQAFASVLSKKFAEGEMIFVEDLSFDEPKSKEAKSVLTALAATEGNEDVVTKKNNVALIALSGRDENVEKSFRNFSHVQVSQLKDVSTVDLLTYKYVVVAKPKDALVTLENRAATKTARKTETPAKAVKTEKKAVAAKVTAKEK